MNTDWHWNTLPLFSLLPKSEWCGWSQTAGKMEMTGRTDRGKGEKIKSFFLRNWFQHESGTASHHIRLDIDWRKRAYQYSTHNPPPLALRVCTRGLCRPDKTSHPQMKSANCTLSPVMLTSKAISCLHTVWNNRFYFQQGGKLRLSVTFVFILLPYAAPLINGSDVMK